MRPVPITQLLRSQAGIISTRQLLAVGKSPGQVRRLTQRMARISDGIHLDGDPSWLAATNAGLLRAGDRGVLGTLAAAHLWGLWIFRAEGEACAKTKWQKRSDLGTVTMLDP